ncbi:hypothetical protein [Bifidobacterium choerinum]|uniref:Uncharacterized protein n=1 Tax=Bifidobacterium choerinum TaxID=35760 RepID=A0A2D3D7C3_9BIFI|nr:hypothetical protein [Bifidobacterium choerinum]ATU20830.1 hypothetical protein BcFMB_07730 [Bifidobacterium choerinum]
MPDDPLNAALAEITNLFTRRQKALDPWTSDHYDYDDGYTSGLAQAIAIIEAHPNAHDKETKS